MNQDFLLEVSIDDQRLDVFEADELQGSYPISTALNGIGFVKDSYCTPVGRFRLAEKIGDGEPMGTIFKARVPIGVWQPGDVTDADLVLTRIIRLAGMDAENANTMERCIYIHGTNREDLIGCPASHGCIRLKNTDMIELFEMVPEGAELIIHAPSRQLTD